uniref:PHB domain-containing protein n=1 Tax=Macrostomum lignano TaxID=282301 RepID=A0A1I8FSY6_9PLAT
HGVDADLPWRPCWPTTPPGKLVRCYNPERLATSLANQPRCSPSLSQPRSVRGALDFEFLSKESAVHGRPANREIIVGHLLIPAPRWPPALARVLPATMYSALLRTVRVANPAACLASDDDQTTWLQMWEPAIRPPRQCSSSTAHTKGILSMPARSVLHPDYLLYYHPGDSQLICCGIPNCRLSSGRNCMLSYSAKPVGIYDSAWSPKHPLLFVAPAPWTDTLSVLNILAAADGRKIHQRPQQQRYAGNSVQTVQRSVCPGGTAVVASQRVGYSSRQSAKMDAAPLRRPFRLSAAACVSLGCDAAATASRGQPQQKQNRQAKSSRWFTEPGAGARAAATWSRALRLKRRSRLSEKGEDKSEAEAAAKAETDEFQAPSPRSPKRLGLGLGHGGRAPEDADTLTMRFTTPCSYVVQHDSGTSAATSWELAAHSCLAFALTYASAEEFAELAEQIGRRILAKPTAGGSRLQLLAALRYLQPAAVTGELKSNGFRAHLHLASSRSAVLPPISVFRRAPSNPYAVFGHVTSQQQQQQRSSSSHVQPGRQSAYQPNLLAMLPIGGPIHLIQLCLLRARRYSQCQCSRLSAKGPAAAHLLLDVPAAPPPPRLSQLATNPHSMCSRQAASSASRRPQAPSIRLSRAISSTKAGLRRLERSASDSAAQAPPPPANLYNPAAYVAQHPPGLPQPPHANPLTAPPPISQMPTANRQRFRRCRSICCRCRCHRASQPAVLPDQFKHFPRVLGDLVGACRLQSAATSRKRQVTVKMDDVERKLAALYELLAQNKLSQPVLDGLTAIVQNLQQKAMQEALGWGVKVLVQTAIEVGVTPEQAAGIDD